MELGPFSFWQRQHCNGTRSNSILIAALHWRWSLTWRWLVTWSPPYRHIKQGPFFLRLHRGRGFNFMTGINLPIVGNLVLQTQPNMLRSRVAHGQYE